MGTRCRTIFCRVDLATGPIAAHNLHLEDLPCLDSRLMVGDIAGAA